MYDLPYHKENNEKVINEFIAQYPFALLTGCDAENKPVATQIPLFLEERSPDENGAGSKKFLSGHIMKNTDHHKAFIHNANVLAVFTGPNIYVSGTWYSNPHTPSTWNYMSVHATGILKFLDDVALIDALRKISLHFENQNKNSPTIYDNLPAEYMHKLMKMIIVFEIEVTKIDTVFKLSQDRDEKSFENIIAKLKERGENGNAIALEMEKRKKLVFPSDKK